MSGFHLFTLAKVPVWVSPWYLLLLIWIGVQNPREGVVFALTITLSLLAHEFGHALVARRYQLSPQILLHGFGGVTGHQQAKTPKQDAFIIAAGPVAGLTLGAVALVTFGMLAPEAVHPLEGLKLVLEGRERGTFLQLVCAELVFFNFFWSVFNALPMWPMDGGQLLRIGMVKLLKPVRGERVTHIIGIATVLAVAIATHYWFSFGPFMMIILALTAFQNISALSAKSKSAAPKTAPESTFARELIDGAERAYKRGDHEQAERLCLELRSEQTVPPPVLARAYGLLGVITTRKGAYEQALGFLRRAPDAPDVVEATAQCFYQLEMYEALKALTETRAFCKLSPETREEILRALGEATARPCAHTDEE